MATKKRASRRRRTNARPRRVSKKIISFERLVVRFASEILRDIQSTINDRITPFISDLASTQRINTDQGELEIINALIDQIEAQYLGFYSREYIADRIRTVYDQLSDIDAREIADVLGLQTLAIAPPGLQGAIDSSVLTTVTSLQGISQTVFNDIRNEIATGVRTGQRWETIAKRLERSMTAPKKPGETATPFKKALNRARFIARNEVGNAQGEINKQQQQAAGVRLYRWQTAEDERVRPTHERLGDETKNNSNIYSWDGEVTVNEITYKPAVDSAYSSQPTIPGQPYNCRCVAIPYIPELE